jgi:translocation and assembly module TamB
MRGGRVVRIGLAALGAVIMLLVVAVGVVSNTRWGHERVRQFALDAVRGSATGQVDIGRVSGNLLTGVTLHDVRIADSSGAPFIEAGRLRTDYAVRALLSRRLEFTDVLLDSATIVLHRYADGRWNYERIFQGDTMATPGDEYGFGHWVVLRNVTMRETRLLVRTPWQPDSTLTATARDSATAAVLNGEGRTAVVRGEDGSLQQLQEFRNINGRLPLIRIVHPDHDTRLVQADSLRLVAFAFAPPAADIRHLRGTFELNGDSLWFGDVGLVLPESRAQLSGRYTFSEGDLALRLRGAPIALRDVQFLYPPLPDSGSAELDLTLDFEGERQHYVVRGLQLATGDARLSGDLGLVIDDSLTLHDTDLIMESVPMTLIRQLAPTAEIPVQGTLSGRAVLNGGPSLLAVDGDLTFRTTDGQANRVVAAGEVGTSDGTVRARGLRVSLSPLHLALVQQFAPPLPLQGQLTGQFTLDGSSDALLRMTALRLAHRDGAHESRINGRIAMRGITASSPDARWLDAALELEPLALGTLNAAAPAAELRGAVSGPVMIVGPFSALMLDADLRTTDGGTVAARGTLDLASRDIGYALDVRTYLFNASQLSGRAPVTSLSAFIQTRARGVDPATMRGTFAAAVNTSSVDTVLVDSVRVGATVRNGLLRLDTLLVHGLGALADAGGTFGLTPGVSGELSWHVRVDSLGPFSRYLPPPDTTERVARPLREAERMAAARRDSMLYEEHVAVARAAGEEVAPAPPGPVAATGIPADSLAGRFQARGTVTGSLNRFDARGTLEGFELIVRGNTVQKLRIDGGWLGARTDDARFEVRASADTVLAAGFALDSLQVTVDHRDPRGEAQISVHQDDARDYALRARYRFEPDEREITFNSLRLRFDTSTWTSPHPGGIRWGGPSLSVDSIELVNGYGGRIFANGLVPGDGPANLQLSVRDFELGDLLGLAQSDIEGRGRLDVDATVTGTGRAPRLEGTVGLRDACYRDTRVPDFTSRLSYAGRVLEADATLADSVSGPRRRTVASVTARLPVDLAFFDVEGSRLLDAPATATVVTDSLPLDLVSRVTDALDRVQGYASGRITMEGPVRDPAFGGALSIANARARVTALGVTLDRVNGMLRIANDSLHLDSLVGWSRGRIAVSGSIGIDDPAQPSFDLRLLADRALLLDNEDGRVRADVDITARGPFDNVAVEGRARLREGVLNLPESDDREVINAGDPAVFAVIDNNDIRTRELVPGESPLLANLRLDLTLGVDRDTWVRSRDANVEIFSDGDLRIVMDRSRSALTLDGVVNTDRGEYKFLSKRFQIKRGAVQFTGTRELNPLLQITGEYEVRQAARQALNIRIIIGGTLQSPRLTLESDAQPPISQSDLLSYLAFGAESGSLLQFGGSSLAGGGAGGGLVGTSAALATRQLTAVALGVMVDELEGQAARSLGADFFTITPANIPPELASGNFGALSTVLRGTQFEFGRYMDTRTFIGLQLQATTTPGFRIERRLGPQQGYTLETTFQPRFFLPEPSLSEQQITKANALGLFLVRRWRF